MNSQLEIIEAEVLKLPPADRTHLLERLIASLDTDPDVEAAWALEADRREAALVPGRRLRFPAPKPSPGCARDWVGDVFVSPGSRA